MVKHERRTRSDKKRDVRPTIHYSLYDVVDRISYITRQPVKDIVEWMCVKAIHSSDVMEYISSHHFRRPYFYEGGMLNGDSSRPPYDYIRQYKGSKKRITTRFKKQDFEDINNVAYSLDTSVSQATALLLECAIKKSDILNLYMNEFVTKELEANRLMALKEVLKFINMNNPYEEQITLFDVVSFIYEEVKDQTDTFKTKISKWLNMNQQHT